MHDYPIYNLDPLIIKDYFQSLPKFPRRLFIRGTFPSDQHLVFLTIVGARDYSTYGKEACETLIKGLRGYPVVIVSGLAHGIDGIAHEAALAAGLTVMAFPGSGLGESVLYPRYNFELGKKILESGGCIISEYQETQAIRQWMFPQRNRLMASISRATLIIEGTHKSGSRITTRLATEYNRDVLAIPGNIFSKNSEAPNELIRMGATPITNPDELLEALGFQIAKQPPLDLFPQSSSDEQQVLKFLSSPMRKGDLIRMLGIPTHTANVLISQMEIKGMIKDMDGELRRN